MALSCRTPSSMCHRSAPTMRQPAGLASVRSGRPLIAPRHCSGRSQLPVCRVMDVSEATFESEVLQSKDAVLLDFWATWCGPCKLISPLMTWAEKEYAGTLKVVKIEVDGNKGLVEKYKVYGLPTFIIFKNGEEVEGSKREGAISKNVLSQYLAANGIAPIPAK